MNLFAPAYLDFLPDWLRLALGIADILIRLAALCWLPYNRKPVVAWAGSWPSSSSPS